MTVTHRALLLNSTYEPLMIITWRRAVSLWVDDKIDVLEEYEAKVHSPSFSMAVPAVVRLVSYKKVKTPTRMRFTKENVFFRDGHRCAYCGCHFAKTHLTLDHVVPSSRGGEKSWNNIVTACRACNNRKGNRTPEQANMPMRYQPRKPEPYRYSPILESVTSIPPQWRQYLEAVLPSRLKHAQSGF